MSGFVPYLSPSVFFIIGSSIGLVLFSILYRGVFIIKGEKGFVGGILLVYCTLISSFVVGFIAYIFAIV